MDARRRNAFTLLELLVVLLIIAGLMALLLPGVQRARESGRRISCTNNLRQLATAVVHFEQSRGEYPGYNNIRATLENGTKMPTGWVFPLLPYLDHAVIYDSFSTGGEQAGVQFPQVSLNVVVCPSDATIERGENVPAASYVANCGLRDARATLRVAGDWPSNGVFQQRFPYDSSFQPVEVNRMSQDMIRDGLAGTLLLSENADSGNWFDWQEQQVAFVWQASVTTLGEAAPRGSASAPPGDEMFRYEELLGINRVFGFGDGATSYITARPSSFHPGGVVAVFCDARGEFINEQIDYLVYCQLMTPRGELSRPAGISGLDASGRARFFKDEDDSRPAAPPFLGRSIYAAAAMEPGSL